MIEKTQKYRDIEEHYKMEDLYHCDEDVQEIKVVCDPRIDCCHAVIALFPYRYSAFILDRFREFKERFVTWVEEDENENYILYLLYTSNRVGGRLNPIFLGEIDKIPGEDFKEHSDRIDKKLWSIVMKWAQEKKSEIEVRLNKSISLKGFIKYWDD